jgi:hypothetical protein
MFLSSVPSCVLCDSVVSLMCGTLTTADTEDTEDAQSKLKSEYYSVGVTDVTRITGMGYALTTASCLKAH